MKAAGVLSGLVVAVLALAGLGASPTPGRRLPVESCADAVYTTPANAPPKPVRAVGLGAAVFNSLAGLTTRRGLDPPTEKLPFYAVKSPLTILARARRGVTIRLLGAGTGTALLYDRMWLERLASWHYALVDVPRSVRLPVCRDAANRPLNTQYAGGFLLWERGCITIEVQQVGEARKRRVTVPVGVPRC